jgi:nucleoside-diphosphate-sugar epimerase
MSSEEEKESASGAREIRSILITSASCDLAEVLAESLSGEGYKIRLTDQTHLTTEHEFVQCALDQDDSTDELVRGIDAIVHVAEPQDDLEGYGGIDYLTRCTYSLLNAAVSQGVSRVIYLSSLELMTQYDENFGVNERWRPRPTVEPYVLAKHLGEYTCREFAREGKIAVLVLRIGKQTPGDPLWVDPRDVAQAVTKALTAPSLGPWPYSDQEANWTIFHIQSASAGARFGIERAKSVLGYEPQF